MADSKSQQPPPPDGWARAIMRNPIKYLFYGLLGAIGLVIVWCLSFIIYPIQLAFGIRTYRNPQYCLRSWPKYIFISMLVLSTVELGLLFSQLWRAYQAGSVEGLHLSIFKWWQYAKNFFVLCVLFAEILHLKFYTEYLDSWIEWWTSMTRDPADKAERGLLDKDMLDKKRSGEAKYGGFTHEKTDTSLVDEKEVKAEVVMNTTDETSALVVDARVQ